MEEAIKNSSEEQVNYEELFKQEQARRRGLQGENAKLKNKTLELEAATKKLKEVTVPKLSSEEQERLEGLKYTDPEAWRVEMNNLDSNTQKHIDEAVAVVKQEIGEKSKQAQLEEAVKNLSSKYSDFSQVINQDILVDELPPKYEKELKSGKISMEEYLEKAYKFLTSTPSVSNPKDSAVPDIGRVGGGTKPTDKAVDEDLKASYSNTIF